VGKLDDWSLIGWPSEEPKGFGWIRPADSIAELEAEPEEPAPADEPDGGSVRGTVSLFGTPPEMKVPRARKKAEVCNKSETVHNAVIAPSGKLADVFVRLRDVKGAWQPPDVDAHMSYRSCVVQPRVQGVMVGQTLEILNEDATSHQLRAAANTTTLFQTTLFQEALAQGTPAVEKTFYIEAVLRVSCDRHPWERGFVVVNEHPFFTVTGVDGAFAIENVPDGSYTVETWHSQFGVKRQQSVRVRRGEATELIFSYSGKDRPPKENPGELRGLF
jgi:hypothetical protein